MNYLYIINSYAQNYFSDYLLNNEEGKNIGLSYFVERGLRPETIETFKLGYCPAEGDIFTKNVISYIYLSYRRNITVSILHHHHHLLDIR